MQYWSKIDRSIDVTETSRPSLLNKYSSEKSYSPYCFGHNISPPHGMLEFPTAASWNAEGVS